MEEITSIVIVTALPDNREAGTMYCIFNETTRTYSLYVSGHNGASGYVVNVS